MELGSLRLIGGVLGTERVQNGVSSDVYEGKIEEKKREKEWERGEEIKGNGGGEKKEEKEKEEGFSKFGWECSLSF